MRSGIELPGETRGLLKPVQRWQPTTIGSIPMGQEIAVTPIQLVAMASTIANGGVYLPPHIVLESTDKTKGGELKPAAFHPEYELPSPLPEGAHRVISEMTAAEMRQMMEGVVLYGTGRPAQLDGYSAGGKTGTAQKIDPRTHTYSKTKYVASFVGFAPVNNPAVTIAVIMDSPTKGSHFGTAVSAPVFHDLAQQILEYLGVSHDQDLKPQNLVAKNTKPAVEDDPQEDPAALQSLFAEVNNLPPDDPLRHPENQAPGDIADAGPGGSTTAAAQPDQNSSPALVEAQPIPPPTLARAAAAPRRDSPLKPTSVSVPNERIAVPSFAGKSLREVVIQANNAGLAVQVVGSGLARGQVPAAGTLVPAGTAIVVRFGP
jgi:cell division protein FtsI (penicillin-binding protein 3)